MQPHIRVPDRVWLHIQDVDPVCPGIDADFNADLDADFNDDWRREDYDSYDSCGYSSYDSQTHDTPCERTSAYTEGDWAKGHTLPAHYFHPASPSCGICVFHRSYNNTHLYCVYSKPVLWRDINCWVSLAFAREHECEANALCPRYQQQMLPSRPPIPPRQYPGN